MKDRELQAVQAPHPTRTQSIPVTSEEPVGVESPAVSITANQKPGEKTQALRKQKLIASGNLHAHIVPAAKIALDFCYPHLDSLGTTACSHVGLCFENPA